MRHSDPPIWNLHTLAYTGLPMGSSKTLSRGRNNRYGVRFLRRAGELIWTGGYDSILICYLVQPHGAYIYQPPSATCHPHYDSLQWVYLAHRLNREQCWHSILEEPRHEES